MHKGIWVFLSCLNYDSFSDSQPIFINCHKINNFPPMCSFLYFPPAYPITSLFVFSSSFFCWSPFCFRLLFITLQRPPSHYPFLIPCSTEKSVTARLLLKKWKEMLLTQCSKRCGTMRAEGGFTACVKIWAGLSFLVNLFKWLGFIICIRRKKVQNKVFLYLGRIFIFLLFCIFLLGFLQNILSHEVEDSYKLCGLASPNQIFWRAS